MRNAYRDEEQVVSSMKEGPATLKPRLILFESTVVPVPVTSMSRDAAGVFERDIDVVGSKIVNITANVLTRDFF